MYPAAMTVESMSRAISLPSSIEHIRSGKLRALAVTTVARSEALPEVPTVSSFVPGHEASYLSVRPRTS
jgi:tripartite-type tricarboxylate transporter receptor subunit TctC